MSNYNYPSEQDFNSDDLNDINFNLSKNIDLYDNSQIFMTDNEMESSPFNNDLLVPKMFAIIKNPIRKSNLDQSSKTQSSQSQTKRPVHHQSNLKKAENISPQNKDKSTSQQQNQPQQSQMKFSQLKDQILNKMLFNFSEINTINNTLLQQIINNPEQNQLQIYQQLFNTQGNPFAHNTPQQQNQQTPQPTQFNDQSQQPLAYNQQQNNFSQILQNFPQQSQQIPQSQTYNPNSSFNYQTVFFNNSNNNMNFELPQQLPFGQNQRQQSGGLFDLNDNSQALYLENNYQNNQDYGDYLYQNNNNNNNNIFENDIQDLLYQNNNSINKPLPQVGTSNGQGLYQVNNIPQVQQQQPQQLQSNSFNQQQQQITSVPQVAQPSYNTNSDPMELIRKMGHLYKQSLEMVVKNSSSDIEKMNKVKSDILNYDRRKRVQRYLEKKRNRLEKKKSLLRYPCRKQFADNRIRIQGKFVSMSQAAQLMSQKYDIKINENQVSLQDLAKLIGQVNSVSQSEQFKNLLKNASQKTVGTGNHEKQKINILTIQNQPEKSQPLVSQESQKLIMSELQRLI